MTSGQGLTGVHLFITIITWGAVLSANLVIDSFHVGRYGEQNKTIRCNYDCTPATPVEFSWEIPPSDVIVRCVPGGSPTVLNPRFNMTVVVESAGIGYTDLIVHNVDRYIPEVTCALEDSGPSFTQKSTELCVLEPGQGNLTIEFVSIKSNGDVKRINPGELCFLEDTHRLFVTCNATGFKPEPTLTVYNDAGMTGLKTLFEANSKTKCQMAPDSAIQYEFTEVNTNFTVQCLAETQMYLTGNTTVHCIYQRTPSEGSSTGYCNTGKIISIVIGCVIVLYEII